MPDVGGIAGNRLKSFVERIEHLLDSEYFARIDAMTFAINHAHEEAAAASHKRVDQIVGAFVDSVAKHPGDSVAITVPGKGGVRITNKGGKKTVETVGAEA